MKRCEPLRAFFRAASARIVVRGQVFHGLNFAEISEFVQAIGRQLLTDKKEFFFELTGWAGAEVSLYPSGFMDFDSHHDLL